MNREHKRKYAQDAESELFTIQTELANMEKLNIEKLNKMPEFTLRSIRANIQKIQDNIKMINWYINNNRR